MDAAPAQSVAPQSGLFALRQFRKEAQRAIRRLPQLQKPDVKLRGAAPTAAIFDSGKTTPSHPTGHSLSASPGFSPRNVRR